MRKTMSLDKKSLSEIQHVDYSDSPRKTKAINAQLIFSCVVVGAASFLFGFDDKIISPVAALSVFVSATLFNPRMIN